jgi:hypothetical protein
VLNFLFLKLTDYDLIFKDFFFKVQVNINLGSNIFDFSIWAIFIAIGTKMTLKIQKTNVKKMLSAGTMFHEAEVTSSNPRPLLCRHVKIYIYIYIYI